MKRITTILLLALGALALQSTQAQNLKTEKGKTSYALGYQLGSGLKDRGMDLDIETVLSAIRDGSRGAKSKLPDDEMKSILTKLQDEARKKALAELKKLSDENKAKGDKFLAANGKKKGVTEMPSGLQIRHIVDGDGRSPLMKEDVMVHMRLSRIDGRELMSTYSTGQPTKIRLDEAMPALQEALPKMRVGSEWRLFVPPSLAYGERGDGRRIGPSETLIIDLKLVSIEK